MRQFGGESNAAGGDTPVDTVMMTVRAAIVPFGVCTVDDGGDIDRGRRRGELHRYPRGESGE